MSRREVVSADFLPRREFTGRDGYCGTMQLYSVAFYADFIMTHHEKQTGAHCAPVRVLLRCIHHILNEDSVAGCRIIDQNMGHSTHQFFVLNDRTAAHE